MFVLVMVKTMPESKRMILEHGIEKGQKFHSSHAHEVEAYE